MKNQKEKIEFNTLNGLRSLLRKPIGLFILAAIVGCVVVLIAMAVVGTTAKLLVYIQVAVMVVVFAVGVFCVLRRLY